MNLAPSDVIARAFSAARDYDRHARVQRRVAQTLAECIMTLPLPPNPRILEFGCGTGFLTEALINLGLRGRWLITDISAPMVERCRDRIGTAAGTRFAVLDAEHGAPDEAGHYDLICSSLAMQWFGDQPRAVDRMLDWLAPGGHGIFTTLGSGTFAEWRAAHAAEGLSPGTPEFMSIAQLSAMAAHSRCRPHQVERFADSHQSAAEFLRSLKAIGAGTAAGSHRPLDPAAMRRVMRRFEAAGSRVTYEVVTCHYRRAGPGAP